MIRTKLTTPIVTLLLSSGLCACSMGELPFDFDAGGADVRTSPAPVPSPGSNAPLVGVQLEAPPRPVACPSGRYWVGRVQGRMLDLGQRPIARGSVNVCGTTCVPSMTNSDGRFDMDVSLCFGTSDEYPHGAVFWFDGLGTRPDVFVDFNPASRAAMGVVRLTAPVFAAAWADGGSAAAPSRSNTALRLVDGQGFVLRVVPSTLEYPLGNTDETLHAVRFPVERLPAYNGPAPTVMYAIGPMDTKLNTVVPVEFPNPGRLAPHTPVEIVAVGNHQSGSRPPSGLLGPVDLGHVSPDGQRVVADNGIRFFGLVGYRPFAHP